MPIKKLHELYEAAEKKVDELKQDLTTDDNNHTQSFSSPVHIKQNTDITYDWIKDEHEIKGYHDTKYDCDLTLTSIREVASFSPFAKLLGVEHGVLGEVKTSVTIRVSSLEIGGNFRHHSLHGLGVVLHLLHDLLVFCLLSISCIGLPMGELTPNVFHQASFELSRQGGHLLLFFGHLCKRYDLW